MIKERRSQRPEARAAARQAAITEGKAKRTDADSKKKAEKAKTATTGGTGAVKNIRNTQVSKQGAKGAAKKPAPTSR